MYRIYENQVLLGTEQVQGENMTSYEFFCLFSVFFFFLSIVYTDYGE